MIKATMNNNRRNLIHTYCLVVHNNRAVCIMTRKILSEVLKRMSIAVNFTRSLAPGLINCICLNRQWRSGAFWLPVRAITMAAHNKRNSNRKL